MKWILLTMLIISLGFVSTSKAQDRVLHIPAIEFLLQPLPAYITQNPWTSTNPVSLCERIKFSKDSTVVLPLIGEIELAQFDSLRNQMVALKDRLLRFSTGGVELSWNIHVQSNNYYRVSVHLMSLH